MTMSDIVINPPSELTVATVDEFIFQLNLPHKQAGSETIDCQHVEDIDGCGIQLLVWFEKQRKDRSSPLVKSPSEPVLAALKLFSVTYLIGEE